MKNSQQVVKVEQGWACLYPKTLLKLMEAIYGLKIMKMEKE